MVGDGAACFAVSSPEQLCDVADHMFEATADRPGWREEPLTRRITEILAREREMAEDPDGWVFPSKRSQSGHATHLDKVFARCVGRASMDPKLVTPHIMRHTAITRLALTGAVIKTIQESSGHQSIAMVLRYTHTQNHAVNGALDRMEGRTLVEHPRARETRSD